jgi:hypothetical protein
VARVVLGFTARIEHHRLQHLHVLPAVEVLRRDARHGRETGAHFVLQPAPAPRRKREPERGADDEQRDELREAERREEPGTQAFHRLSATSAG